MKCPHCFKSLLKVEWSRHDSSESVTRQRSCQHCLKKWWTCEIEIPRTAFFYQNKSEVVRRGSIKFVYDS
jgi:transcriptional regulator NrdR family protein